MLHYNTKTTQRIINIEKNTYNIYILVIAVAYAIEFKSNVMPVSNCITRINPQAFGLNYWSVSIMSCAKH